MTNQEQHSNPLFTLPAGVQTTSDSESAPEQVSFLQPEDSILRALVEGTATVVGDDFFRALVQHLARILNVRYAFVAEFAEVNTRVRTLAFYGNQEFWQNFEFPLENTPCEDVLGGRVCHYPAQVQRLFPLDIELVHLGVESYLGVPLIDSKGEILGHLAVFDDKPMPKESRLMSIFRLFASRATAELERNRADQIRIQSEERLSRILASAMDAIITIDENREITLFNEAAEKVFGIPATNAIGKPIEPLFSRQLFTLVDDYICRILNGEQTPPSIWLPEGLTARRTDEDEFALEATVSTAKISRNRLFTIILRDIDERKRAEAELKTLRMENLYLREELKTEYNFEEIVGASGVMERVFQKISQVAETDSTVLINGETGTGKELIARAIHNRSPRKKRPLIKVNCAALSHGLIESEFFGHEKGAFTGAISTRVGRFELANGGTIFLDEIGEISLEVQAKLLRVLQEQEFERVGGTKTIKVDVRVITATNRDLKKAVDEGRFRADLYYRLNVFPILLPPLRERKQDISLLVRYFVSKHMARLGKRITQISHTAMSQLTAYHWPGNVRELENVVERAVILSQGPVLELVDEIAQLFPAATQTQVVEKSLPLTPKVVPPSFVSLDDMERDYIQKVLESTNWVIEGASGAAKILDINPNTLRSRMQKLNIRRPNRGKESS
ncbi:MAG: sigma 54-interacting transcriptional regulator [Acidobacteria bacterium]|nr:sigma 54-interacting transcriptional regulator [Acidobacteriota bacterium]